jgi:GTP-binding protein YchF
MSFSVGIVGLPNAGKSTLFKALTKQEVKIAPRPFTTLHPNIGIVSVPDKRLEKIARIIKPEKITPTSIEFVDIAGLVKGAHKGQGLGNQFLAQIRNCQALAEVVRDFKADNIEHVEGDINPEKDIEIIKVELLMKDFETIDGLILKLEKKDKQKDKLAVKKREFLEKIKENLAKGNLISELNLTEEEKSELKEYQFLTAKPTVLVLNVGSGNEIKKDNFLLFNLKLEEEISELSLEEKKELKLKSSLDQLILNCYNILDLITFYTIAKGKETRAWTIKKDSKVAQAGGIVHSDFEKKLIRAEVIPYQELIGIGSLEKAKESGLIKTTGKDYIVQDGDVIEFKI